MAACKKKEMQKNHPRVQNAYDHLPAQESRGKGGQGGLNPGTKNCCSTEQIPPGRFYTSKGAKPNQNKKKGGGPKNWKGKNARNHIDGPLPKSEPSKKKLAQRSPVHRTWRTRGEKRTSTKPSVWVGTGLIAKKNCE